MEKLRNPFVPGDRLSGKVVEIYAATRNEERTEGRGRRIDNSYHLTGRDATLASSKIDVMDSDGKVESRLALQTDNGLYFLLPDPIKVELEPVSVEELRKKALAKLTPAERMALLGK